MTPGRAKELMKLANWQGGGCMVLGAKKPPYTPLTYDEDMQVRAVWDTMSGETCWFDALRRIATGKVKVMSELEARYEAMMGAQKAFEDILGKYPDIDRYDRVTLTTPPDLKKAYFTMTACADAYRAYVEYIRSTAPMPGSEG